MKPAYGFYITRLHFEGANKPNAVVEFTRGCNVISGASDTGKTFMLQCIDYMFGAGTPPKIIPEANGYRYLFLELESQPNKRITLMRDLKEDDNTYMAECTIEDFWSLHQQNKVDILTSTKRNAKNKASVSDVLLGLSGFSGNEQLRVNADNKKRSISFRDISHLVVIDEEKIIAEASPVYHIGITQGPTEEDVFRFLITGEDSSDLEEVANATKRKAELKAQISLIDDLNAELSQKISTYLKKQSDTPDTSIDEDIAKINEQYVEVEKSLAAKRKERQQIFEDIDNYEKEIGSRSELLKRFSLLQSQYKSDLERLEFLGEGEHFITQLSDVDCTCPLCGSHISNKNVVSPEYRVAIAAESQKIKKNLDELHATIETNQKEYEELRTALEKLEKQYQSHGEEITLRLQPFKASIQTKLQHLVSQQKEMLALNTYRKQLSDLTNKRAELEAQLADVKKTRGSSGRLDKKLLDAFVAEVKQLLVEWRYLSPNAVINFDSAKRVFDIEIDGNARVSHGKGVRALLYSAFVLGLMKHCYKNSLPHPLVLLLDTPVNAFRDKDSEIKDKQQVDQIIESFFKSVSKLPAEMQLIVFENQEPPVSVRKAINYLHFSGREDVGRAAFIPTKSGE